MSTSSALRNWRSDPLVRGLRLLELRPKRVIAAVAAGTATLGSALALAALSAWLITRAWQMPPVLDLSVAVVSVRALGISRGVFRYIERLTTHDTALRGTTAARSGIYRCLAGGNIAATVGLRRGDLLARTGSDVDTLGDVVVRAIIPIAVAILLAFAAVGILVLISPAAALILAVALAVSGIGAPALAAHAAKKAQEDSAFERARYSEAIVTTLDHATELRVAGRLDQARNRALLADNAAHSAADRAAIPHGFSTAATPLAIGASVIGSLLIGMHLYSSGTMTPMALGILVLLPLSAFEATSTLPDAAIALSRGRIAARRILQILDDAAQKGSGGTTGWDGCGSLSAEQLRCGHPGWRVSAPLNLDGRVSAPLNLDLPPGARVAVVGPSGSGKTTLLTTLAGILAPVSGRVTAGGTELSEIRPQDLRRHIGFFAEDAHLFDTSVLENLRVARGDVTPEQAQAALSAVGLGEWLAGLPEGLDTDLGGGARAVSGGQRRRLLLARALLSPARILLLDEPTEHLDAQEGAQLLRRLLDRDESLVDRDRTVVVVTHQLPADTAVDQVVHVDADATNNSVATP
ncbi:MAG: thiol reductant ABC exporter subunit CydC [Rhodococcus sp.]|nr:thiol reductant ABC exporter subunit CydC [Rhodococcus sp. (in: high G+C Gram-positive bacteria)]